MKNKTKNQPEPVESAARPLWPRWADRVLTGSLLLASVAQAVTVPLLATSTAGAAAGWCLAALLTCAAVYTAAVRTELAYARRELVRLEDVLDDYWWTVEPTVPRPRRPADGDAPW